MTESPLRRPGLADPGPALRAPDSAPPAVSVHGWGSAQGRAMARRLAWNAACSACKRCLASASLRAARSHGGIDWPRDMMASAALGGPSMALFWRRR